MATATPLMDASRSGAEAEASGHRFAAAVLAADGVVSLFGTADFVTVTRRPGVEWEPIIEAVAAAAAGQL